MDTITIFVHVVMQVCRQAIFLNSVTYIHFRQNVTVLVHVACAHYKFDFHNCICAHFICVIQES